MVLSSKVDICIVYIESHDSVVADVSQQLKAAGFSPCLISPQNLALSQLQYCRLVGFWLTPALVSSKGLSLIENSLEHLVFGTHGIVLSYVLDDVPLLLKGRPVIDFSESVLSGIEELSRYIQLQVSGTLSIKQLEMNLRNGILADDVTFQLLVLVEKNKDKEACWALWNPLFSTNYLNLIVDHCSWSIGRMISRVNDKEIESLGFMFIEQSQDSEEELIIDKFAYAIGDVFLSAREYRNDFLMENASRLIERGLNHPNPITQNKYEITRNRLNRMTPANEQVGIHFDYEFRQFYVDGKKVPHGTFSRTEYSLLLYLFEHQNDTTHCTYDELISRVWMKDIYDATVSNTIKSIKNKLPSISRKSAQYIVTHRKKKGNPGGYSLKNPQAHDLLI